MEIDKILFGQLSIGKVDKSFEDLDVNSDNVINQEDLTLASNDVKDVINSLINEVDDEPELIFENTKTNIKTGAKKQENTIEEIFGPDNTQEISLRDGIDVTDASNFEDDVLNSKGVTFVVMGNLGNCWYCNELEEAIVNFKDELSGHAKFYNMSWSANTEFCRDICYNQGGLQQPVAFPQIAKYVDGKFEGIVKTDWMDFSYQTLEDGVQRPVALGNTPNPNNYYGTRPDIIDKLIEYSTTSVNPTLKKDKNGLYETNSKNFSENVENSKGTTYVVMGSLNVEGGCGCPHCWDLYYSILSAQKELESVANIFHMNWDTDADLCRKISYELGNVPKPATFPQIAKFVDGKFVGMLSNTRDYATRDITHSAVQEMLAKAEGIPSLAGNNNSSSAPAESNSSQNNDEQNKINEEKEKLKTEMQELKTQASRKEAEAMFFKSVADKKEAEYKEFSEEFLEGEDTEDYFAKAKLNTLKTSSNNAQAMFEHTQNELNTIRTKYISVSQDYLDL